MIDVINLRKSFGDLEILKGINITINKGDIVAVLGPSGSGKSTFLRCLNCMEDPTSGSIVFKGVDIADMKVDINVHRRHMGMVFQHFNLFNNKTVLQNVMMAPAYLQCKDLKKAKNKNRMIRFKNIFRSKKEELIPITTTKEQIKSETKKQALELLGRIGLEDKADVYPSTLSGGQKQRISIARALVKKPKIYIFDDSFSALDFKTDKVLRKALEEKVGDSTIIIVAQRINTILEADQIIVLDEGRLAGRGTHSELMNTCEVYREIALSQLSEDELERGRE